MNGFPERRKTLNVLKEAALTRGSYDDFPVAPEGVDPAPHISRNHVPQPFWLVTEKDELLVTMSGEGEVRFQDADRTIMRLGAGDVVYLPARTPSRIVPDGELLQVRIKGLPPFTEAVAWYCERCGDLVHSEEFTADVPQRCYWNAVATWNSTAERRACPGCGHVQEPAELGDITWDTVADLLEAVPSEA